MSALLEIVEDIGIRQQLIEVFSDEENGTPNNISKFGCLALAKKGAVVWNAWREAFPIDLGMVVNGEEYVLNRANFSNLTFKEKIDFRLFKFGDYCLFESTVFNSMVNFDTFIFDNTINFRNAKFFQHVNFNSSKFKNVDFSKTEFKKSVDFSKVIFEGVVSFYDAVFRYVYFESTKFLKFVDFTFSTFNSSIKFSDVVFNSNANFKMVTYSGPLQLNKVEFLKDVNFYGALFPKPTTFSDVLFKNNVSFEGAEWCNFGYLETPEKLRQKTAEINGVAPNAFQTVYFLGCKFEGDVNFSNRIFKNSCKFKSIPNSNTSDSSKEKKTIFAKAPKFHNCEIHQDTSFGGAEFPEATGNEDTSTAYRTLKLAFSKMQDVREEQRFFKLEMAEEAKRAKGMRKRLFNTYHKLSDYGFDIYRPIKYLISSVLAFGLIYGALSASTQCLNLNNIYSATDRVISRCDFKPEGIEFVVVQALPIPGLDKISEKAKSEIFSNNALLSLLISVLVIVQKSLSLLFLFLIGLALKNLFKFK